jgi:hypothetical protein
MIKVKELQEEAVRVRRRCEGKIFYCGLSSFNSALFAKASEGKTRVTVEDPDLPGSVRVSESNSFLFISLVIFYD